MGQIHGSRRPRPRPRLVIDNQTGQEKLSVEGQLLGSKQGMGGIGGVGARQGVDVGRR